MTNKINFFKLKTLKTLPKNHPENSKKNQTNKAQTPYSSPTKAQNGGLTIKGTITNINDSLEPWKSKEGKSGYLLKANFLDDHQKNWDLILWNKIAQENYGKLKMDQNIMIENPIFKDENLIYLYYNESNIRISKSFENSQRRNGV